MMDPDLAALIQSLEVLRIEPPTVIYRLYYDDAGDPQVYTCDDLPGNWISVSAEEFAACSYKVKVIDNKLIHITPESVLSKLVPDRDHGTPCHSYSVCVPSNINQPHIKWTLK